MRLKIVLSYSITVILFLTSCSNHLVTDTDKRQEIHQKFEQRSELLLHNRQAQLLDVLSTDLSVQEREALEFLYAYETLSDLSNYDSDHYLQQIRYALKARETFSWGKHVSNDDFLHFVLPPRAGTENMDSARVVIYKELKDRIKDLSMKDAALEVNHWCHEKVTYTGTDGRTSAPLATIRNAKGRCGEESVLTVTALRAVGIPARQIYTPRWAHQDDNHAWVEFWADGAWYFMGACEPEADVNQGWFVEPTRRAMLTAAQTPGQYTGSDVIYSKANYTRLNQISNYGTSKYLAVKVVDKHNTPVENAEVAFMVCNYAELYSLASLKTDNKGLCQLKLGLGDVVVWAQNGNDFSFEKANVANSDTLTITLDGSDFSERTVDVDLVPPVKKEPLSVSPEGKKANRKRLAYEDSIRVAYEKTFISKEEAFAFALKEELDTTEMWQILKASRGNWKDIKRFITETPTEQKEWALAMLDAVSQKDIRDGKADILLSHITHSPSFSDEYTKADYAQYILNPRVMREQLSPYKAFFNSKFDTSFWDEVKNNPATVEQWILKNLTISTEENYIWVPSTPQGVYEMKTCDLGSAKVFFVAMCRTAGVLSRVDRVTGIAQYKKAEQWVNVYLGEAQMEEADEFATISLVTTASTEQACRYSKHFTLAKFDKGRYKTLDYPFNKKLKDFPEKLVLTTGNYMLYTAEREKDGTLLTRSSFFSLEEGEHKEVPVILRNDVKPLESMGKFYLPSQLNTTDGQQDELQACSLNKGMVVVWLDPDKEPTKHVLNDFKELQQSFDALNIPFIFVLPNDDRAMVFNKGDYKLPANASFVADSKLLKDFEQSVGEKFENQLPILTMLSATNEVLYISAGYKIGAGDQLLKVLKQYQE